MLALQNLYILDLLNISNLAYALSITKNVRFLIYDKIQNHSVDCASC